MTPLPLLDLFSGIGGLSLGLERSGGFETAAFCEIDPYCRRVLAKHWPNVMVYQDVRELSAARLAADGIRVDAICGGFPCQDVSIAGKGAGLAGERSGLWRQYARLIDEIRPRIVVVENVAALLGRGFHTVLGDLAALGFDAEWHCIPAAAVGAPHFRDRLWIVAYPNDGGHRQPVQSVGQRGGSAAADAGRNGEIRALADANSPRQLQQEGRIPDQRGWLGDGRQEADVADAYRGDELGRRSFVQMGRLPIAREVAASRDAGGTQWGTEPDVGRVAHGVPGRVDRLRGLGNAVLPQIPEAIGRAIVAARTPPRCTAPNEISAANLGKD